MPDVILTSVNPESKARSLLGIRTALRALGDFTGDESLDHAQIIYDTVQDPKIGEFNIGYTPWEGLAHDAFTALAEHGCASTLRPGDNDVEGYPEVAAPTPEQTLADAQVSAGTPGEKGNFSVEAAKHAIIAVVANDGSLAAALAMLNTMALALDDDPNNISAEAAAFVRETFPQPEVPANLRALLAGRREV